jgi:hypothetical protein
MDAVTMRIIITSTMRKITLSVVDFGWDFIVPDVSYA